MTPEAGATWRINLVRHRAAKTDSPGAEDSSIIASSENANVAQFAAMTLVAAPTARETAARIRLTDVRRSEETVEHGFATILRLRPAIETNRASRDVTVRMVARAEGETIAQLERHLRRLPGLWAPAGEMQMDLGRAFEGDLQITVSAVAGGGSLNASATFAVDEQGRILAGQ
ncbi:MAG: hypothetical protein U9R79_07980 [Armatimonadota bacterium]|nr:hypothetical protein [Armatimonadota bacterium]